MSETAQQLGTRLAHAVLRTCAQAQQDTGASAREIANHTLVNILIELTKSGGDDNSLLMIRQEPGGMYAHLHYDYLSADHDHFKGDFDWGVADHKSEDAP